MAYFYSFIYPIKHTLARVKLLPLRFTVLSLSCVALLVCLCLLAVRSQLLLDAQKQEQALRGVDVLRLSLPELSGFETLLPQKKFTTNDWLSERMASADHLTVIKTDAFQYGYMSHLNQATLFAHLYVNQKMGLAKYSASGLPACVILNPPRDMVKVGGILVMSPYFRCEVSATPQDWYALRFESDMPTIVLHSDHLTVSKQGYYTPFVEWIIVEAKQTCAQLQVESQLPLLCKELAVKRLLSAKTGQELIQLIVKFVWASLAAVVLATLVYFHGLLPMMNVEAALRCALGQSQWQLMRWLWREVSYQCILVALIPALGMFLLSFLSVNQTWLTALGWAWLVCFLYAILMATWSVLFKLNFEMSRLGKLM